MDSCRELCQHGVSQKGLLIVQLWHDSNLLLHFSQNNFVHVKVVRANMMPQNACTSCEQQVILCKLLSFQSNI